MVLFQPGNIPNKIVIELLAELATVYSEKAALHYNDVVSRSLPVLAGIQDENTRVCFSKFFAQVCEAVVIAIESTSDEKNKIKQNVDSMSHLFATAFDLIYAQWLNSKSFTNKIYVVSSLIMMGTLLPENSIRNNLENITNIFVNNLKKDNIKEMILICKSFRIFFENVVEKYKERIETNVGSLLIALFPIFSNVNISPNVKDFDQNFMQLKSELLKIALLLFNNYLEKTFSYLVSRFEVISIVERLSNVYLIKILLVRSEKINDGYRDMLLSAISKATHESDYEFRFALCELINILFEKGNIVIYNFRYVNPRKYY